MQHPRQHRLRQCRDAYDRGYRSSSDAEVPDEYADDEGLRDNWLDGRSEAADDRAWAEANAKSLACSGRKIPY